MGKNLAKELAESHLNKVLESPHQKELGRLLKDRCHLCLFLNHDHSGG